MDSDSDESSPDINLLYDYNRIILGDTIQLDS